MSSVTVQFVLEKTVDCDVGVKVKQYRDVDPEKFRRALLALAYLSNDQLVALAKGDKWRTQAVRGVHSYRGTR